MGDCYKIKKYFSDYIENKLDSSTNKMVAGHLNKCASCKSIVQQMPSMLALLSKSQNFLCSDDFMVKLHKRIHSKRKTIEIPENIKKVSFAISFAIVVIAAVFGINNMLSEKPSNSNIAPVNEYKNVSPASSGTGGSTRTTGTNSFLDQDEHEIKTRDTIQASDSTIIKKAPKDNPRIKYVDQTK